MAVNTVKAPGGWHYINSYTAIVKASPFAAGGGFGAVAVPDQHNSPNKLGGPNGMATEPKESTVVNTATATTGNLTASDTASVNIVVGGTSGPAKFFVVDIGADDVFKYSHTGAASGNFALQSGNTDPRDVAANADGSKLWVLDKDKFVNVYLADGTPQGLWKADSLGAEPEGITLDGNDLWVADRSRKIYWYDRAAVKTTGTLKTTTTFAPSMSGNLKGIVTNGSQLWVVTEGGTDFVYRFTIGRDGSGSPTTLKQDGVWNLAVANSKPTGITLDPTGVFANELWVVDESTDAVYTYGNTLGGGRSLTLGTGTVSSSFKLASANAAPQGIADPYSWTVPADAGGADLQPPANTTAAPGPQPQTPTEPR